MFRNSSASHLRRRAAGEQGELPVQVGLVEVPARGREVGQAQRLARRRSPMQDALDPIEPDDACGRLGRQPDLRPEPRPQMPVTPARLGREIAHGDRAALSAQAAARRN